MILKPDQMKAHWRDTLAPIYLITGDEPFQKDELTDQLRQLARQRGCTERIIFHVDRSFEWTQLLHTSNSLSLFSERRLIELRLEQAKPGDVGAKTLLAYAEQLNGDDLLLITMPKLDAAGKKSKWYKTLEKVGVHVAVWPLDSQQLIGWIAHRLRRLGLSATPKAVQLLAERVEGNLLAAVQEIEKLNLSDERHIDEQTMLEVTDSAQYDIFDLVDSALLGHIKKVVAIVERMKHSGTEVILVLWAFAREIRQLLLMAEQLANGQPMAQVLKAGRIWKKRENIVRTALQRHSVKHWQLYLQQASGIDRMIKGIDHGNVWEALLMLAMAMAGKRLFLSEFELS